MENTNNYSDQWQPYTGDYDKFEYDIKLKDGTVVTNCYPNAGKFHSFSDEFDGESFVEEDVDEIRFSETQRIGIGNEFSNAEEDVEWKTISAERLEQEELERRKKEQLFHEMTSMFGYDSIYEPYMMYGAGLADSTYFHHDNSNRVKKKGAEVIPIRTEPKISRNAVCPKCDSGKKFKKCCGVGV